MIIARAFAEKAHSKTLLSAGSSHSAIKELEKEVPDNLKRKLNTLKKEFEKRD
ncbi:MAG: hypothetical protein QXN53_04050 [Thermoproteota archaeon]